MQSQEEKEMASDHPVTISAVICSCAFERRHLLKEAAESLKAQRVPAHEIIVVIDHSEQLLEWAESTLIGVRIVENVCSKGLSGARNTGVQLSTGRVVAYLDDDATAPANWVADLVEAYRDPAVMAAGGSAVPAWPDDRAPAWFPAEFLWIVGCTYRGMPVRPTPIRNLFGCNMSFRREVFSEIGGFHDAIGRLSDVPLRSCEETEFCIRMTEADPAWKILYLPDLPVRHTVAPHRRSFAYFISRCYNEGLSKAVVTKLSNLDQSLSDERSYVIRTLPLGFISGLRDGLVRFRLSGLQRAAAIVAGLGVTTAGYLWSLWSLRREGNLKTETRLDPIMSGGVGD